MKPDSLSSRFRHQFLGRLPYAEGLNAQERAATALTSSHDSHLGTILGLEHEAVVTLGKRGRPEDDLKASVEEIASKGVELFQASRGGQATLHSPGQLVIYPCVSLHGLKLGVREYVEHLQAATIRFLGELGISAQKGCEEPSLYTSKGKIAFFGIRVSRGIASHGIAINVANDLSLFGLIRSCGISNESFDRVADHIEMNGKNPKGLPPMETLFEAWVRHFLDGIA